MGLSLKAFIQKYSGKVVNVTDNWNPELAGECVSLVQRYIIDCFGATAKARGNAEAWRHSLIKEGIAKAVDNPQYGDIVVWGTDVAGGYGHVAIYLGDGKVFEQNRFGVRKATINSMIKFPTPQKYLRMLAPLTPDEVDKVAETVSSTDFKVGDKVKLDGYLYADSWGVTKGKSRKGTTHTITRIVDTSRPAPYLLNGGLGWVKKSDLKLVNASTQTVTPKPETTATVKIKKGDTVTVKIGSKTYDGKNLADWVTDGITTFKVLEINGDRVVIGNAKGEVTAAVKLDNLIGK